MLKNLKAEMTRNGVRDVQIATLVNCSDRTIRAKLEGENSEFTFSEAEKIRDKYFPSMRLEYLFRNVDSVTG